MMLAQKGTSSVSIGSGSALTPRDFPAHRTPMTATHNGSFASPTESEFSESHDLSDSVNTWDEKKVTEWLKSIGCGAYTDLFKANHVNGSNLVECDQMVLKEIGIKKIGDRVRLFVAIKALRNKTLPNQKKRNRESMAILDRQAMSASSATGSPKQVSHLRGQSTSQNKRFSRQLDITNLDGYYGPTSTRPGSPLAMLGNSSPHESVRREQQRAYFSNPSSAKTPMGWKPDTPGEPPLSSKTTSSRSGYPSDPIVSKLPSNSPWVRVIYGDQTKVVDIKDCRNGDQVVLATLRKLGLPEGQIKNHCFYTADEFCADPDGCRRLGESDLTRLCTDLSRPERGRLILRKIHAGEPSYEEIERARAINKEEIADNHRSAMAANNPRGLAKVSKLTGESLDAMQYPLSPVTFEAPRINFGIQRVPPRMAAINEFSPPKRTDSKRNNKPMKQFLGARPPSELISQEIATYFPDYKKDEIEKAVQLSQRRSARLSRAMNRLSTASNLSMASSLKDAPPMPVIDDHWLNQLPALINNKPAPRPLSVSRFQGSWRDSVMSTLQPLQEESPVEPNRKSYVSFDSNSDNAAITIMDPNGNVTVDEAPGSETNTDPTGSLNEKYRDAIAQDGEGRDPDLEEFLRDDTWDNVKWMRGRHIGSGSFGDVYLALHAITGEVMAVKQVDLPSLGTEVDKRKESMVSALRREIDLMRTFNHPHIVQYLGSSAEDDKLNIFLEYVPGGSIASMLTSYGNFSEQLVRTYCGQILDGLSYLHSKDIVHRDIKGANILVDTAGKAKISDFGISKRAELQAPSVPSKAMHRTSLQGSVFWMAPEVVKQTSYTHKADIWSLGCLIVEMFTGEHPFPNCNQLQAIFQIGQMAKPATPEVCGDEAKAFLERTFDYNIEKRPSADELLKDPFLKKRD